MKTLSKVLHLSVLPLVLQARCAWGVQIPAGAPARVGPLGESERLSIEGVQTFSESDIRRALRTDLDLLPAAFTDLLYRPGTEATWQGDVLRVRTEDFVLRVDGGTGRLLELGSIGGKSTTGAGASGAYRLALRFTAGAFAKAVDQIAASTSTHGDAFQSQRALGSALGFIAAELAMAKPLWTSAPGSSPPQPPAALASALEKLLASSFLDPLQTLLDGTEAQRRDQEFTIPSRPAENQDPARQMIEKVIVWCAGHARELAPAGEPVQASARARSLQVRGVPHAFHSAKAYK